MTPLQTSTGEVVQPSSPAADSSPVTRDNRIVACARYRCDCGTLVIGPLPVEHWQCSECVAVEGLRAELDAWGVQA